MCVCARAREATRCASPPSGQVAPARCHCTHGLYASTDHRASWSQCRVWTPDALWGTHTPSIDHGASVVSGAVRSAAWARGHPCTVLPCGIGTKTAGPPRYNYKSSSFRSTIAIADRIPLPRSEYRTAPYRVRLIAHAQRGTSSRARSTGSTRGHTVIGVHSTTAAECAARRPPRAPGTGRTGTALPSALPLVVLE